MQTADAADAAAAAAAVARSIPTTLGDESNPPTMFVRRHSALCQPGALAPLGCGIQVAEPGFGFRETTVMVVPARVPASV